MSGEPTSSVNEGTRVICVNCGTENDARRSFCGTCGEPIEALAAADGDEPQERSPRRSSSRSTTMLKRLAVLVVVGALLTVVVGALLDLRGDGEASVASRATPDAAGATSDPTSEGTEGSGQNGANGADPQPLPASMITADATSSLDPVPEQGLSYGPENTLDGDVATAWNEGSEGSGVGERLLFTFTEPIELERLEIANGYTKNPQVFSENARVHEARIITDEVTAEFELTDVIEMQTVEGPFGTTSSVTIEILSVYPGTEYEDLAISDIVFWARPAG